MHALREPPWLRAEYLLSDTLHEVGVGAHLAVVKDGHAQVLPLLALQHQLQPLRARRLGCCKQIDAACKS